MPAFRAGAGNSLNRYKLIGIGALLLCVAIPIAPFVAYVNWRNDAYRQKLPPELEAGDLIFIDGESGFNAGCGVAVFELGAGARARIRARGIRALDSAVPAAANDPRDRRDLHWQQTPYVDTGDGLTLADRWQVGLSCADMPRELNLAIDRALRQPGSYFMRLRESAILVIPSAGMVAFVYYG